MEKVELTEEIAAVLEEYVKLQLEERTLRERKQALQEKLKAHLRSEVNRQWFPEVGGERLKITYRINSNIVYDEEVLFNRLGDRYGSILAPDLRKMKTNLPNLGDELTPLLGRIGSPSPEKVKAAIESGLIEPSEFKGTYTKSVKEYVTVAHIKPDQVGLQ